MPIRWDALLARHVARELDEALADARVRAVRLDGSGMDLALLMRERTLLWRLHPLRGYLLVTGEVEPDDADVRVRARIERVTAPPDERVVRLELRPTRGARLDLVVELLGNQWNAVVAERDGGVIRHVLRTRRGRRPLAVGRTYEPPPPSGRAGVAGDLSPDEWRALLERTPPDQRERALVREVAWTSPLNAGWLAGADDPSEGHARWIGMVTEDARPEPVLLETPEGPQPYPFRLGRAAGHACPSLLAAFEACAAHDGASADAAAARLRVGPAAVARLEAGASRALRAATRLRAQLEEAEREDPSALRAEADLILARYGDVPPGASRVRLRGFDGDELTVELDPALPPHENARRRYERAQKLVRARETLPRLLAEAEREHARIGALLEGIERGDVDPRALREAVADGREAPDVAGRGGTRPYRVFRSSGGLEIRVGRGARHNDDLTFRHSAPGDVWLHAQQSPGAHVVLRWSGRGAPPARDLEEAATLAALHSTARTSGLVAVDWTLRKYVRKPRGAGPGTVVPERVRTVFVRPDPALLVELAEP